MARRTMSKTEALQVLAGEELVRVAFRDGESTYLIPLGYVWLGGALFGISEPGHKTRLAARDARVAFQVDTSRETGLCEWRSVTGNGTFEIVTDPGQVRRVRQAFEPLIARTPAWWRREHGAGLARGELVVWKLTPTRLAGRECGPATAAS